MTIRSKSLVSFLQLLATPLQDENEGAAVAPTVQEERGVLTPSFSLSQTPLEGE